ncbi:MAG: DEAD/DEAH box helicase family protein [Ruminococcus sp.]|nr:DEAD/DEAH box helicase family protein [Ruminococcus sp.]
MIQIKTAQKVMPMIYAYTTPEIARHNGWVKIGYTEQEVSKRLDQQTHTADVLYNLEWKGNAIFDDGSGELFKDKDFHSYLRKLGYDNNGQNEWFKIHVPDSKMRFQEFRENRGILQKLDDVIPYKLRTEQEEAVDRAYKYSLTHDKTEFLWNAKPRFGKTLAAYDLCKRMNAKNVLIVTNRPAIANSWYDDYEKFLGVESGYYFVSETESLKGRKGVLSRSQYIDAVMDGDYNCIEFVSLQDLKGAIAFGGEHDKLKEVADMNWDILIVDEAHEGVDTYKTDVAFNQIKRKFTLHLSGTPFKALANDKFPDAAIFNWTYSDEQKRKRDFCSEDGETNPYADLPKLNMFTYQMSEIVRDELSQGIEVQGETEEYAFDLNTFFETRNGRFVYDASVDRFLDALTNQTKFPFSTPELRDELKHTFWILNRVDSAKALAKKLKEHPVFSEYEIILAAGDGKLDDADENQKSYDKVKEAILRSEKTITLSVGQLTTGVTIPEWTAVLMLSNMKSPALYMQAAFRAQNPCLFNVNGQFLRKKNAYVFDFDPARTLTVFEEFANDLNSKTADGRGDADTRKENIRELLNFFPIIGEDAGGEMVELDAEKVMSIPRKIRSQEVVRRGFMSDFLFQNIANVFRAPQEVLDIIGSFTPIKEQDAELGITEDTGNDLSLDDNGEVSLTEDYVIGKATEVFGDKLYSDIGQTLIDKIDEIKAETPNSTDDEFERLKVMFNTQAVAPIIETADNKYGEMLKPSEKKQLEKKLKMNAEIAVNKVYGEFKIKSNMLENERKKALENESVDAEQINAEFDRRKQDAAEKLKQALTESVDRFVQSSGKEVVETIETHNREEAKKGIETSVKDHLRGFSRTIPSFLMAYGTDEVTLANFDKIIPDDVFKEVTSITLEQFRFLRDGGDYTDSETGEIKHFDGNLFDPVVFNDSVKEFLRKREDLSDYFDESQKEDIFDYIPPQKTNQIYTPKWVVKKMVDMLEVENPGCFDNPEKTFIDMYMKSGLYITEIVKRLYNSEKIKKLYPDGNERLKHIFANQVYGLAPTEIIYRIALRFILGFDKDNSITEHNFRQADALVYSKEGTLQEKIDELFG